MEIMEILVNLRRHVPSRVKAARRIFVLGGLLAVAACLFGQQPTVLIRIRVPTNYDDSPQSLNMLRALISKLPPRKVSYSPPITRFIFDQFRVSAVTPTALTFLPRTYALLYRSILRLNGVTSFTQLLAGHDISLPYIPRKALERPNLSNPANAVASIAFFAASAIFPPEHSNVGRPATQTESVETELSAAQATGVMTDPTLAPVSDVANLQMPVRLADVAPDPCAPQTDHQVLTDGQRISIQNALNSKARRDVIVFVLDTGWPDKDKYQQSQGDLRNVLSTVWQQYFHMPPPQPEPAKPFVAASNNHSCYIRRALVELSALDKNRRIKIIYLPLTREQNAKSTLADLLQFRSLYWLQQPSGFAQKPHNKDIAFYRKEAERTVDKSYLDIQTRISKGT
jgi:hypothetical protein